MTQDSMIEMPWGRATQDCGTHNGSAGGASQFNQVDGILDKDLEVPSAES